MAFSDSNPLKFPRRMELENGINVETISSDKNLTYTDSQVQVLTTSGASPIVVTLPEPKNGSYFWLKCQAGSTQAIHVKDAAGNNVIHTPNLGADKGAFVMCDGTNWVVVLEQT